MMTKQQRDWLADRVSDQSSLGTGTGAKVTTPDKDQELLRKAAERAERLRDAPSGSE